MDKEEIEFPKHWEIVLLGDFVHSEKGKKPKNLCERSSEECNIPYIDIKAFEKNIVDKYTDGENSRLCNEDDILIVWDGSRSGLVGKGKNGALGSTLARLNFFGINNDYAYYFMKSKYLEINSRAKGAATPHVDPNLLWNYRFPLPPIEEQNRIVAKIETLFSEMDKSIESLQRAKQKLALYRQSVLKAAFEGELTKAWREAHHDELEDAETLLERIKEEREADYKKRLDEWKAAVKAWEENGKEGKKPAKPKKPKELPPISEEELRELPELPDGWKWERFNNIVQDFSLGKMLDKQKNKGHLKPYLRNINVRWGSFDISNLLEMRIEKSEHERYCVKKGDLIICEGGEPGRCAVWSKNDCIVYLQKALHRVRFYKSSVLPEYIQKFLYFSSQNKRLEHFFTGTTIKHLTGQSLAKVEVPICSAQEQQQIVNEIEFRFSEVDTLEKAIDETYKKPKCCGRAF